MAVVAQEQCSEETTISNTNTIHLSLEMISVEPTLLLVVRECLEDLAAGGGQPAQPGKILRTTGQSSAYFVLVFYSVVAKLGQLWLDMHVRESALQLI